VSGESLTRGKTDLAKGSARIAQRAR